MARPTRRRGPLRTRATSETDVRLGRLVRLLMNHPTVVISGTKLAAEIPTSHSELWHMIQQLRNLGVQIAGHYGSGYRLKTMPDLLLPEMLQARLRGTMFDKRVRHYYRVTSTNTLALEAALAGAPEGTVFLAEQQTAGRGRGNHDWHSPQLAGIYCSVVLRPPLPPTEVLVLSLAAGLAVQSAVEQIDTRVVVDLKWPNDLLIEERKFSGILTEMSAEATAVRHIVIGIGINVNQTEFPGELRRTAASLRQATGAEWSRLELCAALLKSLEREYQNLVANPEAHAQVLRRFEERSSSVRGRRVSIEENGAVEGTTEGLDPRGFLRVRTREGMRVVYSGTVKLI